MEQSSKSRKTYAVNDFLLLKGSYFIGPLSALRRLINEAERSGDISEIDEQNILKSNLFMTESSIASIGDNTIKNSLEKFIPLASSWSHFLPVPRCQDYYFSTINKGHELYVPSFSGMSIVSLERCPNSLCRAIEKKFNNDRGLNPYLINYVGILAKFDSSAVCSTNLYVDNSMWNSIEINSSNLYVKLVKLTT